MDVGPLNLKIPLSILLLAHALKSELKLIIDGGYADKSEQMSPQVEEETPVILRGVGKSLKKTKIILK